MIVPAARRADANSASNGFGEPIAHNDARRPEYTPTKLQSPLAFGTVAVFDTVSLTVATPTGSFLPASDRVKARQALKRERQSSRVRPGAASLLHQTTPRPNSPAGSPVPHRSGHAAGGSARSWPAELIVDDTRSAGRAALRGNVQRLRSAQLPGQTHGHIDSLR